MSSRQDEPNPAAVAALRGTLCGLTLTAVIAAVIFLRWWLGL